MRHAARFLPVVGSTVSHYRIVGALGSGGMGLVYEAEDVRLGRRVALKFLPKELSDDGHALERFRREARAASALNHSHICTIHDIGEHDGQQFIVMEKLTGRTLAERLEEGAFELPELFELSIQTADALEAAHEKGIVHRDIKPGNIFVTERGEAKVMDFGLAKLAPRRLRVAEVMGAATISASADEHLTSPGTAVGTIAYMSPEQARGEELDARTDIFSLGVVLYQMATGRPAFPGQTSAVIFDGILNRAPAAATQINPALPHSFEQVINKALEKDRRLRYQTAAELKNDLRRLKRAAESGTEIVPARKPDRRRVIMIAAAVAMALVLVFALWWNHIGRWLRGAGPRRSTVAVLPFQNIRTDQEVDFLRLGIPDQIATALSYAPSFDLRPFATTRRYAANPEFDPQQAGRELGVTDIITGQFWREGTNLRVTLEVVDVEKNRITWRDTLTVPQQAMMALEEQLATRVRQSIVPLLGASAEMDPGSRPKNAEAFDLLLRSASFTLDSEPNQEAIRLLERAVELDPHYAAAWNALATRYYMHAQYGNGGQAAYERSETARHRALALDPNLVAALRGDIVDSAERGDLLNAYDQARQLLRKRPDSVDAHFTLAYVLRYAGLLQESARECDTALAINRDPHLRSCAYTFMSLGNYGRAEEFIRLDPGSEWTAQFRGTIALYQGDTRQALEHFRKTARPPGAREPMLTACLIGKPWGESAKQLEAVTMANRDPEPKFGIAGVMAFCGNQDAALRLLRRAVEQNYCSVPAIDTVPLFASLRNLQEFAEIRRAGERCQQRFLAHREQKR